MSTPKAQHTPGPWQLDVDASPSYVTIDGSAPRSLHIIYGAGENPKDVAFVGEERDEDREEFEANAHLIAAAPELYEALRELTERANYLLAVAEQESVARPEDFAALDAARAVLAKLSHSEKGE